ncbi:MAG: DEAD/DEAH box helicase [Cytophagales bacterium]|nr:DEAD/DEAH box helicase [Armatimonadota bacterium]
MNADHFLARFKRHPDYKDQIVHVEQIPAREARWGELDAPLPSRLSGALALQGVTQLYCHQAQAIDLARMGHHLIVTTPTASGKSLCYNAPVLETLLLDPGARALYLFPTKALAQDQRGKLEALRLHAEIATATYDGDTPKEERGWVKKTARVVITNPDMLHIGILPYHTGWGTFLRNLRYVVIDEAHTYRGVFGAHVANILRRLRRVCDRYGAHPQFIACSATIANPGELFGRLTGLEAEAISGDGAPTGRKHFIFWNPPIYDPATGARRSSNAEATTLFTTLVGEGVRTIAFTRARKTAELLLTYARRAFESTGTQAGLVKKIISYRAGYTAEQRRDIERRLFNGELTGVTATNALELGVDIGGVDACVLTGYPGTVASTWQQAGRAGRRQGDSLAILVAADNPLDQFLMRRPEYFFGKPHEHAALDPTNRHILGAHLLCAAYEMPLTDDDFALFGGERAAHITHRLCEEEALAARGDRFVYAGSEYPAGLISIRSASANQYVIVDDTRRGAVLGTVEEGKAFETLHPGAVYLHLGESYIVETLDPQNFRAHVRPAQANYFTETRINSQIAIKEIYDSKEFGDTVAYFGLVTVTTQVVGFRQKQLFSDEVLGNFDLDLPEQVFETEAVWYPLPSGLAYDLERANLDLAGGVHAGEHASISLLPLFALCDRNDIGGVSTPWHPQVGAPAIFVHDAHPGGVGIAETGYRLIEEWLGATRTLLEECPCETGCPSCIQSPKCGNNNEPLDKEAAKAILRGIMK